MSKSEYLEESFPRFYKISQTTHNAAKPNPRKTGCYQQENPRNPKKTGSQKPDGNEMEIKKPGICEHEIARFIITPYTVTNLYNIL